MQAQDLAQDSTALPIFDNPQAWYGRDMHKSTAWVHMLSPVECDEIENAVQQAMAKGIDLVKMKRSDFPLPTVGKRLQAMGQDIKMVAALHCCAGLTHSA